MPWSPSDATSHTKAANTPAKQSRWSATADAVLARTGDEGQAIRIANAGMHEKVRHNPSGKKWPSRYRKD